MAEEILALKTRKQVYNLIENSPGLHLREMARRLNMRTSLIEYHLRYLASNELITVIHEGGYSRYFVKDKIGGENRKDTLGSREKRILALLRQETPLQLVLFLLEKPDSRHRDILGQIQKAPSTISFHLKKLVNKDIIAYTKHARERIYYIKNPEEIIRLLITYKPGPESLVDGFIRIWEDLYG